MHLLLAALAQGMLTGKYLNGIPEGSRASRDYSLTKDLLTDEALDKIRALNDLAADVGRRSPRWRSPGRSATRVSPRHSSREQLAQLEENVGALHRLDFTDDELAEIDRHATDSGINIWAIERG